MDSVDSVSSFVEFFFIFLWTKFTNRVQHISFTFFQIKRSVNTDLHDNVDYNHYNIVLKQCDIVVALLSLLSVVTLFYYYLIKMTLFCKLQSNLSRGNTIKLCRYLSTSQPRRSENVDADSELQVVFQILKNI